MKTSSERPDIPPVERSKAWSYLVTNLLVLPGLGSVMGGWRFSGYAQMLLALAGFLVTLVALVKVAWIWAHTFELPNEPWLYRWAIIGIAVFLLSWFWSLATSLTLLRESR